MKLKDTIHYNWYKQLFAIFIVFILLLASFRVTDANFSDVFNNADQMAIFLKRFLQPDWSFVPSLIGPMVKTIQMSILGTAIGVLFALPFSFMATTDVTKNYFLTTVVRFILDLVRTIPNLLLAAIFVAIVGIGEFTGVLTIAVFTFGMFSQLLYEAIETIDHGPIEAAESIGANKIQIAFWAVAPQVLQHIVSYALYSLEVNVRASTILGYVGAGGIGVILNTSLSLLNYGRASIIIVSIFVVVVIIDLISEAIRKRLV